jgi:hypothetical protein
LLVCLSSLLSMCTSHPAISFLVNYRWWGRLCLNTRWKLCIPSGCAGEECASVTCF